MTRHSAGRAQVERILRELSTRGADVEATALVWDLDGTLLDPRPRMLSTVHSFGHPEVELKRVCSTWQETASALGLEARSFFEHWNEHYWNEAQFELDQPIDETVWCARWADSIGVPNIVLTGRVEPNRTVTLAQLERIAVRAQELILKPKMKTSTPAWKARQIAAMPKRGIVPGAFITDSVEEIAAVRARLPELPCVLVAADPAPSIADVPVWTPSRADRGP